MPSRMLGRLWVGLSIALEDKSRVFRASFAGVFTPQPRSASGRGVRVMGAEMWPPTHDTGTGGPAPGEWLASGPASWCSWRVAVLLGAAGLFKSAVRTGVHTEPGAEWTTGVSGIGSAYTYPHPHGNLTRNRLSHPQCAGRRRPAHRATPSCAWISPTSACCSENSASRETKC